MNKRPTSIDRGGWPNMRVGLLACLLAWIYSGCTPGDGGPSSASKEPAVKVPPIVQVTGERADFNLGTVTPGSKHRVIFAIHNDSDKPLKLVKIRGNCSCIISAEAPDHIAAGQTAQVVAIFDTPDLNVTYGAELIVLTDDPQRKTIRLGVMASIHR